MLTYSNDVNNNVHVFPQVTAPQVLHRNNRESFNEHRALYQCTQHSLTVLRAISQIVLTPSLTLTTKRVHCLSVFSGDLGTPFLFSFTKNLSLEEREAREEGKNRVNERQKEEEKNTMRTKVLAQWGAKPPQSIQFSAAGMASFSKNTLKTESVRICKII